MRVAAAAVLVLLLALPAGAAPPRRATLELVRLAPLVVEGSAFRAGERVVLTATTSDKHRQLALVARRNGSFTARFELRLDRCTPLRVRAIGGRSSRAILQVEPGCERTKRRGPG
jgi:hypothetical protein